MTFTHIKAGIAGLLITATALVAVMTAPTAALLGLVSRFGRIHAEEDGEIVQNILWVAGFAAIAIAVVAIIRTFVITEAQNLPTSGG